MRLARTWALLTFSLVFDDCGDYLASAYDLGEDTTLCWATPASSAAGYADAQRVDCEGAFVLIDDNWPDLFVAGELYKLGYSTYVPAALRPTNEVLHANIHGCSRKVGFCTPFVKDTPGLSTHSQELEGPLVQNRASFVSEVSLPAGQYTMIAHVRWKDEDGTVHNMARASARNVEKAMDEVIFGMIGMGVSLVVVFTCLVGYMMWRLARYFRRLKVVARKAYEGRVQRVLEAYAQTKRLAFPMCVISYLDFKEQRELICHETARSKKLLYYLDTVDDIEEAEEEYSILFVSHQWTHTSHPDLNGEHFEAILLAIDSIAEKQGLICSEMMIWIDYTSIPQRADSLQVLSISSLPVYAASSSHFLVIAPTVYNSLSSKTYDLQTYQARGWCRLEQWARLTQRSMENMFVCVGEQGPAIPAKDEKEFAAKAMHVFRGDFTHEEDRYNLIDTMVGLYVMLLEKLSERALDDHKEGLLAEVHENLATVFPEQYFEDLTELANYIVEGGFVPRLSHGSEIDAVVTRAQTAQTSITPMPISVPRSRRREIMRFLRWV